MPAGGAGRGSRTFVRCNADGSLLTHIVTVQYNKSLARSRSLRAAAATLSLPNPVLADILGRRRWRRIGQVDHIPCRRRRRGPRRAARNNNLLPGRQLLGSGFLRTRCGHGRFRERSRRRRRGRRRYRSWWQGLRRTRARGGGGPSRRPRHRCRRGGGGARRRRKRQCWGRRRRLRRRHLRRGRRWQGLRGRCPRQGRGQCRRRRRRREVQGRGWGRCYRDRGRS